MDSMVRDMNKNEQLSAFFDGENSLKESEDIRRIMSSDEENANCETIWKSFSLTRDVMRAEAVTPVNWDIADKVALALEQEPTYQMHDQIVKSTKKNNIVSLKSEQPTVSEARKTMPSWMRQLTQAGIAAAVSVMVIFGVQQYNVDGEMETINGQPPVLRTIPLSGGASPVSYSTESLRTKANYQEEEQHRRINELFQDFELQRRLNAAELEQENEHKGTQD